MTELNYKRAFEVSIVHFVEWKKISTNTSLTQTDLFYFLQNRHKNSKTNVRDK